MSKPKEYSWMTKNTLMTYTFIALAILAGVSYISFGVTSIVACIIAVVVAVALDYLLSLVMKDRGPQNTLSAAVFGLVVALSYSLGVYATFTVDIVPLVAPDAYYFVAAISAVGMVVFKKLQGLLGRKYVNPAAAAKLVVLLPFLYQTLMIPNHIRELRSLAAPIGYSGPHPFALLMQACMVHPSAISASLPFSQSDVFQMLILQKFHGWIGGVSSLAVIIVGIGLFLVARKYIKWRITLAYLAMVTVMALALTAVYGIVPGDTWLQDALLRVGFELFMGSSIFMAFFMAIDPATSPLTHTGQVVFGLGLGVLTVLIQTYLGFLGGSILALVIMNLTSPFLDKLGTLKPTEAKKEPKLPKTKQFEAVKTTECIRCGACMRSCCHKLSPILIKEAFDKSKKERLSELRADLCEGCGHCSFVCPARIDLKAAVLRAKVSLRNEGCAP